MAGDARVREGAVDPVTVGEGTREIQREGLPSRRVACDERFEGLAREAGVVLWEAVLVRVADPDRPDRHRARQELAARRVLVSKVERSGIDVFERERIVGERLDAEAR